MLVKVAEFQSDFWVLYISFAHGGGGGIYTVWMTDSSVILS